MLLQWVRGERLLSKIVENKSASIIIDSYTVFFHYLENEWRIRIPVCMELVSENTCMYRVSYRIQYLQEIITVHIFREAKGYCDYVKKQLESKVITLGSTQDNTIQIFDEELQGQFIRIDLLEGKIEGLQEDMPGIFCEETLLHGSCFQKGKWYAFLNFRFLIHDDFLMVNTVENFICLFGEYTPYCKCKDLKNVPYIERNYLHGIKIISDSFTASLDTSFIPELSETRPLMFTIGPALCMVFGSLSSGMFSAYERYLETGETEAMLRIMILPLTMLISVLVFTPVNRWWDKCQQKKKIQKARQQQQINIDNVLALYIKQKQEYDMYLETVFPLPYQIFYTVQKNHQFMYLDTMRNDFLTIRLGNKKTKFPFALEQNKDIPSELIHETEKMEERPCTIHLPSCRHLEIHDESETRNLEKYVLLQLFTLYSYEDLCIVYKDTMHRYPLLEKLPHMHTSKNQTASVYVCFDEEDTADMEDKICIFLSHSKRYIYDTVVSFHEHHGTVLTRSTQKEQDFTFFEKTNDVFDKVAGYCLLDQVSSSHASCSFLQCNCEEDLNSHTLLEQWNRNQNTHSLLCCVGISQHHTPIYLDLHETGDGPHGLVAGMTGSGKSEFVISMILSLALRYSYEDLQFAIIDFKGGSILQALKKGKYLLPHITGYLSNLDVEEMERSLIGFSKECTYREELFTAMHAYVHEPVTSLDLYQKYWTSESGLPRLGHLVILIDEFAELKSEKPDFMEDLIRIARVGRSLGMHLILITQRPGGTISSEIRANTAFQVCLKVQNDQDSMEVIKEKNAAYLKQPGDCILVSATKHIQGKSFYCNERCNESFRILRDSNPQRNHTDPMTPSVREKILDTFRELSVTPLRQLWLPPLETIQKDMLKEGSIGLADEYYERKYVPVFLESSMLVCCREAHKRQMFFLHVLYGLSKCEIYVLSENKKIFSYPCVNAVIGTEETERIEELEKHIQVSETDIIVLIEDVESFLNGEQENKELFENWLKRSSGKGFTLICGMLQIDTLRYALSSKFKRKLVLDIQDAQLTGAFLDGKIPVKKLGDAQCLLKMNEHIVTMTYPLADNETFEVLQKRVCYTDYRIYTMEEKVQNFDTIGKMCLGKRFSDGQYIFAENKERVVFISVYSSQQEKYKKHFASSIFVFLTVDEFQRDFNKWKNHACIFLGNAIKEQYVISYTKKIKMGRNDAVYVKEYMHTKIRMVYVE